jgi:hypothetical protein
MQFLRIESSGRLKLVALLDWADYRNQASRAMKRKVSKQINLRVKRRAA